MIKHITGKESVVNIPTAVSNVVSWRQEGIHYNKNEIFMDIVETINVLQDFNSTVIKSEIVGTVQVKSQLSGMPQCKLGLSDKFIQEIVNSQNSKAISDFGDIKFHQCVRLSTFENSKEIKFIPPDGDF